MQERICERLEGSRVSDLAERCGRSHLDRRRAAAESLDQRLDGRVPDTDKRPRRSQAGLPVAVLEGIDERHDRRLPDHLERLDSLSPLAVLLIMQFIDQSHDRRRSNHAKRPRCTHLDCTIRVVERPDQRLDSAGPNLRNRSPLLLCNQVVDRLTFGLRHPSVPSKSLRGAQPYAVTFILKRLPELGDGLSADPDERIDRLQPDSVVRVPQCPDERADGHIPEIDEHVPGPLPDQSITVRERENQRVDGRFPHRYQDLRRNLPAIRAPESQDESTDSRTSDPDQHPGGCPAERLLVQGTDQGFHSRLPDPDQRLTNRPLMSLFAEQADQGGSRRGPDAGKRLRSPRLYPRITIGEPRHQKVDGRGSEIRDVGPLLQRDQVHSLLLHPPGNPASPLEDHGSPHTDPGILVPECFNKRFMCSIADPGERSRRPRLSIAVLAEEGDEGAYRRRTDADQGVDGLPVEAAAVAPDDFDDGRDSLMRPEPAQDLDSILPGGVGPPLEATAGLPMATSASAAAGATTLSARAPTSGPTAAERPISPSVAAASLRIGSSSPLSVRIRGTTAGAPIRASSTHCSRAIRYHARSASFQGSQPIPSRISAA